MLLLAMVLIPRSVWAIIAGFQQGAIDNPIWFARSPAKIESHVAFASCVAGWAVLIAMMGLLAYVSADLLRRSPRS
jgi:hypothetical protein